MGKNPADQFYWGDWLNDVELQAASASTRGIWINALCRMWFSKKKGEISGNKMSLVKMCNCTEAEFDIFWSEAQILGFCEVSQNSHGILALQNRRMYRTEKKREVDRLRAKKSYYKKKSHVDSKKTSRPLSSSSTSKKNTRAPASQKTYQRGGLDLNGDLPEAPFCHYCKKVRTLMTDSDGHPKCPECW